MKFFKLTCVLLFVVSSCKTVDLDSPTVEEEFPLKGPKRAVLAEISFPAQNEGFASVESIQDKIKKLSQELKLSQEQLDTVRLFKGGELNHLLGNIQSSESANNIIKTLRDMGVVLNIHQQQILDATLPQDPADFQFSEENTKQFVKYLFNRAMELLQKKRPDFIHCLKITGSKSFGELLMKWQECKVFRIPIPDPAYLTSLIWILPSI